MINQKGFIPIFIFVGIIILGFIGGIYYLGITKNNKLEQVRQFIFRDEKTNSNKIYYLLHHSGTVSAYEQSRNLNLLNDAYSEIYSYDLVTKQTSLVFSDQNEEFGMDPPTYASWDVAKVGNTKLFYKAMERKSYPLKGGFFLDLNTGKSKIDLTLPEVRYLLSDMKGKLLVYVPEQDLGTIEIKDTATGEIKKIIDLKNEIDPYLFIEGLSLSPDGNHIAVETRNGFPPDAWDELLVVDVATGQVTKLINKDQSIGPWKPFWTDNSHLIFVANKQLITGVYTMDIEGKNLQNVYTFKGRSNGIACGNNFSDAMPDPTGTAFYLIDCIDQADKSQAGGRLVTKSQILRTDLKTGQTETLTEFPTPNNNRLSVSFIY